MSGRGEPPDEGWPRRGAGATPLELDNLSLVVGRALASVVVTVDGDLDLPGCELLEDMLTDLIEGQGNLTVSVDLGRAIVEPAAVQVLEAAAQRARDVGGRFIVKEPPEDTHQALESGPAGELVEVLPRRLRG